MKNSKSGLIVLVVVIVAVVAVASLAYNFLSNKVEVNQFSDPSSVVKTDNNAEKSPSVEVEGEPETPKSDKPVSNKAPDFVVYDVDGNQVKLSDFEGKPTVVNFWASWCPPCKQEMPDFNKVYLDMGEEVNFVMIDLVDGDQESQQDGIKFVEESGFEFPIYFDTDQKAAYTYGVSSIPTTIFIDKDGHLVTGAQGAISEEKLRKGIQMAIEA